MLSTYRLLLPLLSAAALAWPAAARADVGDEIIVKRAASVSAAANADVRADADVHLVDALPLPGVQVVRADPGERDDALDALNADPRVVWAEPNRRVQAFAVPPDQAFQDQWGIRNAGSSWPHGTFDADIDADEAWAVTKGQGVTVAVVDTGVDTSHPDLAANLATNAGEVGQDVHGADLRANGVDDDQNGYVDDWRGWDWVESDNDPDDQRGHGTHVAGTIAAADDGVGATGVAPRAKLMTLRVLGADGFGSSASVAAAFYYAGEAGLPIVNASLGSLGYTQAERDAIHAHPGTLYVVAAGNGGNDSVGDDNDSIPTYPCAYDEANILCVAASDAYDARAGFSNVGASSVDLAAPGVSVASDFPTYMTTVNQARYGVGYEVMSGTSMATPHTAGAAALVASVHPAWSAQQVKKQLLDTVDPIAAFAGLTVTGGRLNAGRAVGAPIDAPAVPAGVQATPGAGQVALSWDPNHEPDFDHYVVHYRVQGASFWSLSGTTTATSSTAVVGVNDELVELSVSAVDATGNQSDRAIVTSTPHDPNPAPSPTPTPQPPGPTPTPTPTPTAPPVETPQPPPVVTPPPVVIPPPGVTPPPVLPPRTPTVPGPTGGSAQLSGVSLRGRVVACQAGCASKAKPATLRFTVSVDTDVELSLQLQTCRKRVCKLGKATSRTLFFAHGTQSLSIRGRLAGMQLTVGRYRLTLKPGVGKPAVVNLTVARR